MPHPNQIMLKTAYQAFACGDLLPLAAMLSDNVVWHATGTSPAAGDYVGKDEVFGYFGGFFTKMIELYGGSLHIEVRDVLANDTHGVVLTTERGTSQGETLTFTSIHLFTIRDGTCTHVTSYQDDCYHQFWSPPAATARAARHSAGQPG